MQTLKNIIIAIAAVAVVGLAVNAFAHGGKGWGGGWGRHGGGMAYSGGCGAGSDNPLSKEDVAQFDQQREAFFAETRELRESLAEKEGEMQDVMAKSEPDVATASALQQDISDLQSQIDQKRIAHMIEMRKLNPNAGQGFRAGGPKRGQGGCGGGGNCWR